MAAFNPAGYAAFWGLTALAVGLFAWRLYRLGRYLSLGRREEKLTHKGRRALATLATLLVHWDQFKNFSPKDRAGIVHAVFPLGFILFAVYYLVFVIIGYGFGISETLNNSNLFQYYTWILDIVSLLVIAGAVWAIIRRYVVQPARLKGEQTGAALVILLMVIIIPTTYLFTAASDIALKPPAFATGAHPSPVSLLISQVFNNADQETIQVANTALFWSNWAAVLFTLVYIAYSRLLHMLASLGNHFSRRAAHPGELRTIDLETAESFGASKITDLGRKQLLDLYACVSCGKCQEACPATLSGKPLNPKQLIQDLKGHLLEVAPGLLKNENTASVLPGGVVGQEAIWACTTCRACDDICPVYVEHIDKIIDLRRNLVLEQGCLPEAAEAALRSIEDRGHPWRGATAGRSQWAEGLDIKTIDESGSTDTLLWVGCSGALEERSIQVTRAIARVLKLAGVDFGALGNRESCCGEPARRLGNEYLFQMQAEKNIQTLKACGVRRIITACPHGYNTLKNEYPAFGGSFEVIHHSQFIAQLISEGKLQTAKPCDGTITYHDACYLGRYNEVFQPPRDIIKSLPGIRLVEMADHGRHSLCCGGGGGRMWQEETTGRRISEMRIQQAKQTGADILATACPFCLQMFQDAVKTENGEASLQIRDIAELISEAAEE